MLAPSIQKYFNQFFRGELNLQFSFLQFHSVGGGSINDTYQVKIDDHPTFFLKVNSHRDIRSFFKKKKAGLSFSVIKRSSVCLA